MSNEELKQSYKKARSVWYSQEKKIEKASKYMNWEIMQHAVLVYAMKNNITDVEAREILER